MATLTLCMQETPKSVADPEGFRGFAQPPLPVPIFKSHEKEIIWSH